MFVELHLLQNFSPSNLNRDDTGAPKDCEFGGYRRARISSQCIKRSIRNHFKSQALLPTENLAHRTKRLAEEVVKRLPAEKREDPQARAVIDTAIKGTGLGLDEKGLTQYLLFLGDGEIQKVASLIAQNWEKLLPKPASTTPATPKKPNKKDEKKEAKETVPADLRKQLLDALDGGRAADLALFGRMLADMPDKSRDAASQVAHALSTNKVSMEMDYFTAVDDLQSEDATGAGMIGSVEFNSSCFYRYANVDVTLLTRNLDGDAELANSTLRAFLRAAVEAVPTGKQNSMAAHNPPSCVLAVVRDRGLWSLANAFVQPVRPNEKKSLILQSIEALDAYWGKLTETYGNEGIRYRGLCLLEDAKLAHLAKVNLDATNEKPKFERLIDEVLAAAGGTREEAS